MASTYSTNLALELIGTGDQAGTWGNTTNTNLGTLIEQAVSGYVTQAVATGTDTTITIPNGATGVARNMFIELTGTGGTNTNLIVPANKKLYFIYNNSTGAVTVKVSGQTGVSVPQGKKMILVSNGTDVVAADNYIADFGSNSATITQLTSTSGTITTLTSSSATITNLLGTTLTISGNSFLATSSGNVGIGTSSPTGKLQVNSSTPTSSAPFTGTQIKVVGDGVNNSNYSGIAYRVSTSSDNFGWTAGAIRTTDVDVGAFIWKWHNNSAAGTEYARIPSTGQFLIGTTSTVSEEVLSAAGSTAGWRIGSNRTAVLGSGNAAGGFNYSGGNASSATAGVVYARIESEVSSATASSESGALVLLTRNSGTLAERARITAGGEVGIGATPNTYEKVQIGGTLPTSGNISVGLAHRGTVPSGSTSAAYGIVNGVYTAAASFTVGNYYQFYAHDVTKGAGSAITNNYGFYCAPLTFGTNNYGFYSDIASGTGRWNFYAAGTAANYMAGALSVGTTAAGVAGEIRATNNITAYYSDARLKDFKGKIGNALNKVSQLNGYYYTENEKAEEFGYNNKELQVGVSAQEVKAVLPEVVAPAPFDMDAENKSKSGENYMTVRYEKLVPLLIEAIKELTAKVEALEGKK